MIPKPEHCSGCVGACWPDRGFVPAHGSGENGVLIVAEAAGENEMKEGVPLIGKAGHFFFSQLERVGIKREGFRVHNVLSCRPPDNKLARMPYESDSILRCSPFIDRTIYDHVASRQAMGKSAVILTLDRIAFKRILGLDDRDPVLKGDYLCYPFWSKQYGCWVIAADHPSFLMRGNHHLVQVLQFAVRRALEIADQGLSLLRHDYCLDPAPGTFAQWVRDFKASWDIEPTELSYDIETAYKKKVESEDDLSKDEEGADHSILRVSFSYVSHTGKTETCSVRWEGAYLSGIEELFAHPSVKLGWNSSIYDDPRVSKNLGLTVRSIDGMVAWHILNSALPKSLGFVTPFYVQNTEMWKHLSDTEPAFYNAKDAEMALLNFRGIRRDLERADLWSVFERYILKLDHALGYMSSKGILLDQEARQDAETKLQGLLNEIEQKMEASVPVEARKLKILKREPKNADGYNPVTHMVPVKYCEVCGLQNPNKHHTKHCPNWIAVKYDEPMIVWAKPLEFKLSNQGMQKYQSVLRHQAVLSRREKKITFDEKAVMQLMKKYPKDPLYPTIIEFRGVQKLLSTYVGVTDDTGRITGGMPTAADGRIHTTFNHNPSTLRLASQDPNLQNLPRPDADPTALANLIRMLVRAADGHLLLARDFSGIEAVLVGFEACDPGYIRLAKHDVHTFYTMYGLYELEHRFLSSDLPELSWPDDKLFPYLAEMKRVVKHERNSLYKHLVHGANYMQSPKGAAEKIFSDTGVEYPVKLVSNVMDVYFALFKSIRRWHTAVMDQADKDGYVRNSFGFVHRFNKVYDWKRECGQWVKQPGPDANKVIAFKPQSNAAGIIFDAIIRLYFDRFEEAGQWMRLQVHDEIFCEVPESLVERVDAVLREEMERPITVMRLPKSYGMGEFLQIDTEAKRGLRWGAMK